MVGMRTGFAESIEVALQISHGSMVILGIRRHQCRRMYNGRLWFWLVPCTCMYVESSRLVMTMWTRSGTLIPLRRKFDPTNISQLAMETMSTTKPPHDAAGTHKSATAHHDEDDFNLLRKRRKRPLRII